MSANKIAIIIPAYNEDQVIGDLINKIKTLKIDGCSIIVVDDSSSDNTAIIAKKNGAIVIRHLVNTGAGGATATGLSYAFKNNFEIAATMDADGQHDPKDLAKGIKIIKKNNIDLLIGSRLLVPGEMSKIKSLGNRGLSLATFLLFGVNVTDSQSGLRIFSKKAQDNLKWSTNGYEFCSEMLWRAKQNKLIIKEFPIKTIYTDYSISKGQNNWNAYNILKTLLNKRIEEFFSE